MSAASADRRALRPVGFDYVGAERGYWARMRDGGGREVILTEYPASLLAMARAGVLVGEAKADAERLAALETASEEGHDQPQVV